MRDTPDEPHEAAPQAPILLEGSRDHRRIYPDISTIAVTAILCPNDEGKLAESIKQEKKLTSTLSYEALASEFGPIVIKNGEIVKSAATRVHQAQALNKLKQEGRIIGRDHISSLPSPYSNDGLIAHGDLSGPLESNSLYNKTPNSSHSKSHSGNHSLGAFDLETGKQNFLTNPHSNPTNTDSKDVEGVLSDFLYKADGHNQSMTKKKLASLAVMSVGIIYGDIGTSVLYVYKTIFMNGIPGSTLEEQQEMVLGACSCVIYLLTFVTFFKYILLVLRADNNGQGGVFALVSLIPKIGKLRGGTKSFVVRDNLLIWAIVGACFLIGDGIVTPAISVLSALEGIKTYAPKFSSAIIPLSCVILFLLFMVQRYGTGKVGLTFAPLMVIWFASLFMIGAYQISLEPSIFKAFSPYYILRFMVRLGPYQGFSVWSSVILCVTGAEAMYSDLGHFHKTPIRISWTVFVFPCLLINYLGQGSLLLRNPEFYADPFFRSVPTSSLQWPMLVLATMSTVIASQALISGVFQLMFQAMALNAFPKIKVVHTSTENAGQIYVPLMNYVLMVGSIALVAVFQHSEGLAAMYGIAVSGDMVLTSFFYTLIMAFTWHSPWYQIVGYMVVFWSIDLLLLTSNLLKLATGGWVTILIAAFFFIFMYVFWVAEKDLQKAKFAKRCTMSHLCDIVRTTPRSKGVGVFVSNALEDVPSCVPFLADRFNSLPRLVICMSMVCTSSSPYVPPEDQIVWHIVDPDLGIHKLLVQFGYAQHEMSPETALEKAKEYGLSIKDGETVTYMIERDVVSYNKTSSNWKIFKIKMYNVMLCVTRDRMKEFRLKDNDVCEIGIQVHV